MATARAAFLRFSLRSTLSSFSGKQTEDLAVKVLHVAPTPSFKTFLEEQSYLGHMQIFWEQYAMLPVRGCAEWEVPKLAGTLSFALILTLVVAVLGNTSVPEQFLLANDIAVGLY